MLIAPYRILVSDIRSDGSQNMGYRISDEILHRTIPTFQIEFPIFDANSIFHANSTFHVNSIFHVNNLFHVPI